MLATFEELGGKKEKKKKREVRLLCFKILPIQMHPQYNHTYFEELGILAEKALPSLSCSFKWNVAPLQANGSTRAAYLPFTKMTGLHCSGACSLRLHVLRLSQDKTS